MPNEITIDWEKSFYITEKEHLENEKLKAEIIKNTKEFKIAAGNQEDRYLARLIK